MRLFTTSLLAVFAVASVAAGGDRRDELFASWAQAQGAVKSLVSEFTVKFKDRIGSSETAHRGVVRLMRTQNGEVYASYHLEGAKSVVNNKTKSFDAILNGGSVYVLNNDAKTAYKRAIPTAELPGFLESYFNPLVVLLDRTRAEAKYEISVVRQDEFYTYLRLKPKQTRQTGWSQPDRDEVHLALLNKESSTVPADMPRQFLSVSRFGDVFTFDIIAWRLNGKDGPQLEEFAKPENRPGWRVVEHP